MVSIRVLLIVSPRKTSIWKDIYSHDSWLIIYLLNNKDTPEWIYVENISSTKPNILIPLFMSSKYVLGHDISFQQFVCTLNWKSP